MRFGAEGDDVRGRAAGPDWGVTPSDGSGGLEVRLEEGSCVVVKRADTRGLNSSCDWMLWWREDFWFLPSIPGLASGSEHFFVSLAGDSLLSTEPVSVSVLGPVRLVSPWFSSGWNSAGPSVSPAPPSLHPSSRSAANPRSADTDSVELSARGPSVSSCSDSSAAS